MQPLTTIFELVYFLLFLSTIYLGVFLVAAYLPKREVKPRDQKQKNRFLVIFPAYREDLVIIDSVRVFLQQTYPAEYYQIVVIADTLKKETLTALNKLPIEVVEADYSNRSKAKALKRALAYKEGQNFEGVVILDADNHVERDFLMAMNIHLNNGQKAVQAHRTFKNRNSEVAILDGLSEEINNTIFRKGHIRLGFSSALIGSGMLFEYNWFVEHVVHLETAGEDKELELMLLRERIYIYYDEDTLVYDEKVSHVENFSNQRKRWLNAQLSLLTDAISYIPEAIRERNFDLLDKVIQWFILPRVLHMGAICIGTFISLFISKQLFSQWLTLCFLQLAILYLAIPKRLRQKEVLCCSGALLRLGWVMACNLLQVRKKQTQFIHTPHGGESDHNKPKE